MEQKVERISSRELSRMMKVTASQIRQDLNNFGGFGQQGYGYNVKNLRAEIAKILGLDHVHTMIIIGAGHLGTAIANYLNFESYGFHAICLFDKRPELEGKNVRGIPIRMISELPDFLKENRVDIAALTLPKANAIEVAKILVEYGISAFWNFAHTDLNLIVPEGVVVENVHLSESLMRISYNLAQQDSRPDR